MACAPIGPTIALAVHPDDLPGAQVCCAVIAASEITVALGHAESITFKDRHRPAADAVASRARVAER